MRLSELLEKVNDKVFWKNFHEEKVVLDGMYKLVAMAGWIKINAKNQFKSDQFRIVAKTIKGAEVGWVNFEVKNDKLEALDLVVQPAHRRKGLATEMYKFARELGNDIAPSKLQTGMGKQFWSKIDHSTGDRRVTEKWDDSGAADANGRWAKYRDGKISVDAMATWLYNSRVHKKTKEEKLKSAYGSISQQQNTSKLISGAKADELHAALKKKYD